VLLRAAVGVVVGVVIGSLSLAQAFDRTRVRCLASTPDNVDGPTGVSFEHVFDPVGRRRYLRVSGARSVTGAPATP
jgi:hypothetical protein